MVTLLSYLFIILLFVYWLFILVFDERKIFFNSLVLISFLQNFASSSKRRLASFLSVTQFIHPEILSKGVSFTH